MEPEELLDATREMERERMRPDLVSYGHLDSLPDQDRLRVLRSNHDLFQAGIDPNNCALTYAKEVENERAVLVVLDKKNKPSDPMALEMIEYSKSRMKDYWSQIHLSCNRSPPDDESQIYYDFEPALLEWHRNMYREDEDRE